MSYTLTPNFGYKKIDVLTELDTWGGLLNQNWDDLDGDLVAVNAAIAGKANITHTHHWADILDPPSAFPPSAHTHPTSQIINLDSQLANKAALVHTHVKADITDFAHTHTTSQVTGLDTALALLAPKASPTFTGNPLAPTPILGDNSQSVATTAFVNSALPSYTDYNLGVPVMNTVYTQAHGLSTYPRDMLILAKCVTANFGYAVGEMLYFTTLPSLDTGGGDDRRTVWLSADTTNSYATVGNETSFYFLRKDTHILAAITLANWNLILRVFK